VSGDPASLPFCYLTTRGRRSGNPHRIEIWFALDAGTLYLLSGGRDRSDWVRNLMTHPDVTLELGEECRTARARVLEPQSAEDERARLLLVAKYQPGYGEDLSKWGRTALPVAIEWGLGLSRT
jgi:deazaflavin-dependent oxidoreductase (nitroreductase family)